MFSFPILFGHSDWSKTHVLFNKKRSLGRVLHCDKTRPAFENTEEIQKTRVAADVFSTFFRVFSNYNFHNSPQFYTLVKHGFLTNKEHVQGPIYVITE